MKYGALLILPLFAFVAAASRVSYEGYKVLRTQPLNEAHAEILRDLRNEDVFDFWQDPNVGRSADVLASPELLPMLEQFLRENNIQFSVMIDNLEELRRSNENESMKRNKMNLGYDWNDYYRHDEINNFIDELASTNPEFINTVSIGKTVEGRDMRVIQITKAGSGAPNVWVDAGKLFEKNFVKSTNILNLGWVNTVWKFQDFSITLILREINFENSSNAKLAILTHLEALILNL